MASLPNLLTASRLLFTVGILAAIHHSAWLVALILLLIASLTDALDGWAARRLNQVSAFGRMFDPLVDKIMVLTIFLYLITQPEAGLPAWMVAAILARELLVTGVRSEVERRGIAFAADNWGKYKTALQLLYIGYVFVYLWLNTPTDYWTLGRDVLAWSVLVLTVGSGLHYIGRAWPILRSDA